MHYVVLYWKAQVLYGVLLKQLRVEYCNTLVTLRNDLSYFGFLILHRPLPDLSSLLSPSGQDVCTYLVLAPTRFASPPFMHLTPS